MDDALHHSEAQAQTTDRIGGVLFLLAAFLLLNPLRILYVTESVAATAWVNATGSETSYIIAFDIGFILFSIIVPVMFFLRKKGTPFLVATLFLANIAFVAMNGTIAQNLPAAARHTTDGFRMWEMVLSAVLFVAWTAYLLFSRRVRETFVR